MCCLYIWPLVLLYIFTTFLYFMVSCPTIRCQYWRLTNNKYTFQYNRDKCHRGTYFGKKYFHNIWAANILWWISKAQEFWGLHNTIQIDNYLTWTAFSSLLKLFFLLWKSACMLTFIDGKTTTSFLLWSFSILAGFLLTAIG